MTVWIVVEREYHEGGEVHGVFSTVEAAQDHAFDLMRRSHQTGPWEPMDPTFVNLDVVMAWRAGAGAVTIEKHDVAESAS